MPGKVAATKVEIMKVVSIVGLAGAGKSEVARVFEENGFARVRFGQLTDEELKARGLEPGEKNERYVRELLRKEYGMDAFARLNLPRIDEALEVSNVVVDGLYSWEEYILLKSYYVDNFYMVAVWASPKTRYRRLVQRRERALDAGEGRSRDIAEIENLNKAGPIAMADFTISNESSPQDLRQETERIIAALHEEGKQANR
jgi:dephospho-CoA kinase